MQDNIEPDLSHPIVSLSLGCACIFLLGGENRDDEPLAFLLRSGDAVLMSQQCRRCYHAVPRYVFPSPNYAHSSLLLQESGNDISIDECISMRESAYDL